MRNEGESVSQSEAGVKREETEEELQGLKALALARFMARLKPRPTSILPIDCDPQRFSNPLAAVKVSSLAPS